MIYNPNAGTKVDIRPLIKSHFDQQSIPFHFYPTEKYFDSFTFAHTLDLTQHSALVAVGGDGTVHEVVNGMLARGDGMMLPVAVIPNGSGNTVSHTLGMGNDIQLALEYIS